MTDQHLSIGEVLTLLQAEFPDVTISKIRFLESQGLVDPERTPSGYRKFYETDIERLRWILTQQRENFLPLKVIKDRLAAVEGIPADEPGAVAVTERPAADHAGDEEPTAAAAAPAPASAALPTVRASMPAGELPGQPEPIWMADVARANGRRVKRRAAADPEVSLTTDELLVASTISREALGQLVQYGLITNHTLGSEAYYDADALEIATKAAGFLARGVEARHLRMFKVSAEREAGFLEQLAMPLLKQRNPEARRDAVEMVEELTELGADLRTALLRANLRQHLDRA